MAEGAGWSVSASVQDTVDDPIAGRPNRVIAHGDAVDRVLCGAWRWPAQSVDGAAD
jgi:hypothetical protein